MKCVITQYIGLFIWIISFLSIWKYENVLVVWEWTQRFQL